MPASKQLHPEDAQVLLSVMQILFSDPIVKAERWWRTELKAERIFKEMRERDKRPLEAVNFEWVALRAKQWIQKKEKLRLRSKS